MTHKLAFISFAIALVFTSCNGDEIDDLKKKINKLESQIGSDEPIKVKFSTTNYENESVVKNTSFNFKSTDYETTRIDDNEDGTYDVYIERFSDVEWYEGATLNFTYNPETDEVTNPRGGTYFRSTDRNIDAYFSTQFSGNTLDINITSFSISTGKISLTAHFSTTITSENNVYGDRAMICDFTFKGQGTIFILGGGAG